jgi:glycerol uptake facilitator-like aquaporin
MLQVYMGAHMSGAYFNPALVAGAVVAQKMTPQKAGGYLVAQLTGAFIAAGMQLIPVVAVRPSCILFIRLQY